MAKSTFTIRPAAIADALAIYQLILFGTKQGKILKRSRAEIRRSIKHFFVAEAMGEVVGCCALEIYNRKLSEMRSLAVRDDWQNCGIATALLGKCLKVAKQQHIYEVLAITDREGLFKRKGFVEQLQGQKALFLRPGQSV